MRYGRVPARVTLRGEPGGWHYVIVDKDGGEERGELTGPDPDWRRDPEPPWWRRRLDETAEGLREHVAWAVTDRTFDELGVETEIAWFGVREPVEWEGLVTLRDPDPARFPGEVPPFAITLEPGRGALLPDDHLLFSTVAPDAWVTLAAVAERCGSRPPRSSFLCGWADHRSIRVGRSELSVSTERGEDGRERLAEVHGRRGPGWSGNPELRFRMDGIDLLDEPAEDVVALFRDLGHEVNRRGGTWHLPATGLRLYRREGTDRFAGVSLQLPDALASWYRFR